MQKLVLCSWPGALQIVQYLKKSKHYFSICCYSSSDNICCFLRGKLLLGPRRKDILVSQQHQPVVCKAHVEHQQQLGHRQPCRTAQLIHEALQQQQQHQAAMTQESAFPFIALPAPMDTTSLFQLACSLIDVQPLHARPAHDGVCLKGHVWSPAQFHSSLHAYYAGVWSRLLSMLCHVSMTGACKDVYQVQTTGICMHSLHPDASGTLM